MVREAPYGIDRRVRIAPGVDGGAAGKRAMVWVGPPLLASTPRPGFATPTWLPLTPLVRPPEPPVPIRLYALDEDTVPPWRRDIVGRRTAASAVGVQSDDRVVQGGHPRPRCRAEPPLERCCRRWCRWRPSVSWSCRNARRRSGAVVGRVVGDGAVEINTPPPSYRCRRRSPRPSCRRWCNVR